LKNSKNPSQNELKESVRAATELTNQHTTHLLNKFHVNHLFHKLFLSVYFHCHVFVHDYALIISILKMQCNLILDTANLILYQQPQKKLSKTE